MLVGRERELKLLLDVFTRARAGSAQLVTLLGEQGIGKTRLAAELAEHAREHAVVVRAPWTDLPQPLPYLPLLRALWDAALEGAPDPAADLSRDEALLGLLRFGERQLDRGPLVIVLDNLHLADEAMLDLVDQAADRFHELPLLLLCLARDELLERRPTWAGGRLNAMTLALNPLSEEQSRELAAAAGIDERSQDWVVAAAEGNPLFVEELVEYVRAQGLPASGELPPPPTISALVEQRLAALEPEELAVLQRAAVVGRTFEAAPVEALYGRPVAETLRRLAERQLLRRWRGGYVFHHQLLLEVVLRSLPDAERPELHRRLADWYEETGGGEAMALRPMHLYRAYAYEPDPELRHDVSRALAFAGKRAAARGNVQAAVAALERAVELVEGEERLPLLYELANVKAEAGDLAAAQEIWREAEEQAAQSGDRRTQLLAHLARSDSQTFNAHTIVEAEQAAHAAIAEFEAAGDALGLSRGWEVLRLVHSYACRSAEALDAAQRALAYAREAGSEEDVLRLLPIVAAQHYWGPTPAHEALPELERILADLGPHPSGRGNLLWMIGGVKAMLGDFDEARRCYRESGALNRDLGRTIRDAGVTQIGAAIEWLAGDLDAAERELRRGIRVLEAGGERAFRSTLLAYLARVLAAHGRPEPAQAAATAALELADPDDEATNVYAHAALAQTGPDRELHVARVREVLARIDEPVTRGDGFYDLAQALDGEEAEAALAQAAELYAAKGIVVRRDARFSRAG